MLLLVVLLVLIGSVVFDLITRKDLFFWIEGVFFGIAATFTALKRCFLSLRRLLSSR